MNDRVELAPAAKRQLRKLDPPSRRRLQAAMDLLSENPRPPAAKMLVASDGAWRVRVGSYRVIYDIEDERLIILVLAVAHRREICRSLKTRATS